MRALFFAFSLFVCAATTCSAENTYDPSPEHLWNRLHRTLFARTFADGHLEIHTELHTLDPLLFYNSRVLLEGDGHKNALAILDEFLTAHGESLIHDPAKRVMLQRDLWAAFDSAAWVADDWVHKNRHEPAAIAIRTRLARIIKQLALNEKEIQALPDNFRAALNSKEFQAAYDPAHPEQPFLPPDLFDENGTWVRYNENSGRPIAKSHVEAVDGRAVFFSFIRLPEGREATRAYLHSVNNKTLPQFPPGTMVALVRRALVVDDQAKIRVSPLTESVQIRVYRTISANPNAVKEEGNPGIQDVNEFMLNRSEFFAGKHGLKPLGPKEYPVGFGPLKPFDAMFNDKDPQAKLPTTFVNTLLALRNCTSCHQQPGIYSVETIARGFRNHASDSHEYFYSPVVYDFAVDASYTVKWKYKQFDWGLLQGLMEGQK